MKTLLVACMLFTGIVGTAHSKARLDCTPDPCCTNAVCDNKNGVLIYPPQCTKGPTCVQGTDRSKKSTSLENLLKKYTKS